MKHILCIFLGMLLFVFFACSGPTIPQPHVESVQILYSKQEGDEPSVWQLSPADTPHKIYQPGLLAQYTTDGTHILFLSAGDSLGYRQTLCQTDTAGAHFQRLATFPQGIRFFYATRDGEDIILLVENRLYQGVDIWRYHVMTATLTPVIEQVSVLDVSEMTGRILYTKTTDYHHINQRLRWISLDGMAGDTLSFSAMNARFFGGDSFVVVVTKDYTNEPAIPLTFLYRLDTGQRIDLPGIQEYPTLLTTSPVSHTLLFLKSNAASVGGSVLQILTGPMLQGPSVLLEQGLATLPQYTATGETFVYTITQNKDTDMNQICISDLTGTVTPLLTARGIMSSDIQITDTAP